MENEKYEDIVNNDNLSEFKKMDIEINYHSLNYDYCLTKSFIKINDEMKIANYILDNNKEFDYFILLQNIIRNHPELNYPKNLLDKLFNNKTIDEVINHSNEIEFFYKLLTTDYYKKNSIIFEEQKTKIKNNNRNVIDFNSPYLYSSAIDHHCNNLSHKGMLNLAYQISNKKLTKKVFQSCMNTIFGRGFTNNIENIKTEDEKWYQTILGMMIVLLPNPKDALNFQEYKLKEIVREKEKLFILNIFDKIEDIKKEITYIEKKEIIKSIDDNSNIYKINSNIKRI